jgi:hypothetical protein
MTGNSSQKIKLNQANFDPQECHNLILIALKQLRQLPAYRVSKKSEYMLMRFLIHEIDESIRKISLKNLKNTHELKIDKDKDFQDITEIIPAGV